jgi:D-cysteine desulfhydrase family pyridoxal phosphate-dependent enzyme
MNLPRVPLANLPTPIEPLPRLSAHLNGPRIWVKRDDQTGLALGGNKTRKLEFLLAEAQAHGARTLITVGAAQSNHCRQTAAAAARKGFKCILVLNSDSTPRPEGNLLLDELFGAEIVWTQYENRSEILKQVYDTAWEKGQRPYLIPLGASNFLGAAGYVAAFEEFIQQKASADWIVIASSSGGTQAGLALGVKMSGWQGHLLGISIDEPETHLKEWVAELSNGTAGRLGEKIKLNKNDILVNADYLGEGYGILGAPEIEAIRVFARLEGLLLDPVYTGRAAAGMIDLIRKGFFAKDSDVLFWHTGGTPALFAEPYRSQILQAN